MGRVAKERLPIGDTGKFLSFGWKTVGDIFRIRFADPDRPGKYVEVSTGVPVPKGWTPAKQAPADALHAAAIIIVKRFNPAPANDPKRGTWETALEELAKLPHVRPKTLIGYKSVIRNIRDILPAVKRPSEIDQREAVRFHTLYSSGTFTRSNKSDATKHTRNAVTVNWQLRTCRALWKQFRKLGYVTSNPWKEIELPRLPKINPKVPTEDTIKTFFGWLAERYPGWDFVRLFVEVKAVSGCRLFDLCQVKSSQLVKDVLTITADQDKTHRERQIPLPADIAATLHRLKGKTFLWERYSQDVKKYRPGPKNRSEFTPKILYAGVKSIFRQYGKAHPEAPLTTHQFRRRAITLMVMATGSVDQTAAALGVSALTARNHYLDAQRAFDGEELLRKMAGVLRVS